jgi:hypothetical protein
MRWVSADNSFTPAMVAGGQEVVMADYGNAGYLDAGYRSLRAFARDCRFMRIDARELLTAGAYVLLADGWVVAKEYLS